MILKKVKYPSEDFYSFENGKKIDNECIEKWINEGIKKVQEQLEYGVEAPHYLCGSGDTVVMVFFSQDIEDNVFDDNNYFDIIVAKKYENFSPTIGELRDINLEENILPNTKGLQIDKNKQYKYDVKIKNGKKHYEIWEA